MLPVLLVYRGRWAEHRTPDGRPAKGRRGAGVATTANGRIVAINGCCTAAHRFYQTAEIYQPQTNRWHAFPGLPVPRAGLVAARGPHGLIFAIAGFAGAPPNTPASHSLDAIRVR